MHVNKVRECRDCGGLGMSHRVLCQSFSESGPTHNRVYVPPPLAICFLGLSRSFLEVFHIIGYIFQYTVLSFILECRTICGSFRWAFALQELSYLKNYNNIVWNVQSEELLVSRGGLLC